MKITQKIFDPPKADIASPVVYTSGHACHRIVDRYLNHYENARYGWTIPIHNLSNSWMGDLQDRGKHTVEAVQRAHAEIVAAIMELPHLTQIYTATEHHRVKRTMLAATYTTFLIQRSDRALGLRGIDIVHERHRYQTSIFDPMVHLIPHAIARFMERARRPPEDLISQIGKITYLARFIERSVGSKKPIAFALPEGLLHGRIGHGQNESHFGWHLQTQQDFLRTPYTRLQPRGRSLDNRDIDFVTFYDTAMLNPRLRAVYDMLLAIQDECWEGAKILYGQEFYARPATEDGDRKIARAITTLETALASPAWRDYMRHREDQESQSALDTIPTTCSEEQHSFTDLDRSAPKQQAAAKPAFLTRGPKLDDSSSRVVAVALRSAESQWSSKPT